jgi:hypothetical protein
MSKEESNYLTEYFIDEFSKCLDDLESENFDANKAKNLIDKYYSQIFQEKIVPLYLESV